MNTIHILSAVVGGAAGFAYWNYIGCISGVCPLQTNPWLSTIFGILLGITILPELYSRIANKPGSVSQPAYENLDSAGFAGKMNDPDAVLVDVRTAQEFAQKHIPGAIHLDFYARDFTSKITALDSSKTILVYCRTGRRSGEAAKILTEAGFKDVANLKKGIVRWEGPTSK